MEAKLAYLVCSVPSFPLRTRGYLRAAQHRYIDILLHIHSGHEHICRVSVT